MRAAAVAAVAVTVDVGGSTDCGEYCGSEGHCGRGLVLFCTGALFAWQSRWARAGDTASGCCVPVGTHGTRSLQVPVRDSERWFALKGSNALR